MNTTNIPIINSFGAALRGASFLALLALAPLQTNAVSIAITPNNQSVSLGSTVSFDLVISGLFDGAAPSLGAFDLDVSYMASVLEFQSLAFGTVLQEPGSTPGLDRDYADVPSSELVNQFWISVQLPDDLNSLQPDTFTLTTLSFKAIGVGVASLGIGINAFGDGFGDPLTLDTVEGGSITVRPVDPVGVPDSANSAHLLLGSLGLLLLSKRPRNDSLRANS